MLCVVSRDFFQTRHRRRRWKLCRTGFALSSGRGASTYAATCDSVGRSALLLRLTHNAQVVVVQPGYVQTDISLNSFAADLEYVVRRCSLLSSRIPLSSCSCVTAISRWLVRGRQVGQVPQGEGGAVPLLRAVAQEEGGGRWSKSAHRSGHPARRGRTPAREDHHRPSAPRKALTPLCDTQQQLTTHSAHTHTRPMPAPGTW